MGAERTLYEKVRFDADSQACLMEPQSVGPPAVFTPTIDMGGVPGAVGTRHESYDEVVFCIQVGAALDATTALDVEALESVTAAAAQGAAGTATARTLASGAKAITQLVAGDDFATLNQKVLIYVRADELDVDNLYRYIQLEVTVSAADTVLLAIEADRTIASDEPVTGLTPAGNIAEIVT